MKLVVTFFGVKSKYFGGNWLPKLAGFLGRTQKNNPTFDPHEYYIKCPPIDIIAFCVNSSSSFLRDADCNGRISNRPVLDNYRSNYIISNYWH